MTSAAERPSGHNEDEEHYRREAMGAFAHEVRTPLTSIRMVLELARRDGDEDRLVLDRELADMLVSSIASLQELADDLQEASRMERRKLALSRGPADLRAAVEAAATLVGPKIRLEGELPPPLEGPWDPSRLVRALAGLVESVNRAGDGMGIVAFEHERKPAEVRLVFASGEPRGDSKPIASDAGFAFFRSRQYLLAVGARLEYERRERFFRVAATLPL